MKLSIPLVADKNRVKAEIYIKDKCFTVNVYFTTHKSTHDFDDEKAMFNYLKNIGLEPNDFKLAPF